MGDPKEEADASKETYEPRWSATNETMVVGGPKIFLVGWLKIHYSLRSLMAKPHHPITPTRNTIMADTPTPAPPPAPPPEVQEKRGKLFVNEGALFGVVHIKATGVEEKNTVTLEGPHGGNGVCTPLAKHGDYLHFGVYIPNYGILKQGEMAPGNISFTIINDAQAPPPPPQTSPVYNLVLDINELPDGTQVISVS